MNSLLMKLPENVLALLENFWVEEYETDYRHLFEIEIFEKHQQQTK
jgi:hypothetical protein